MLARARGLIPQLADANKKLEQDIKNNTDVSIESVDASKPYIKMVCIYPSYAYSNIYILHCFRYS